MVGEELPQVHDVHDAGGLVPPERQDEAEELRVVELRVPLREDELRLGCFPLEVRLEGEEGGRGYFFTSFKTKYSVRKRTILKFH